MNIRGRFIAFLGRYWWILILILIAITVIGNHFTDMSVLQYVLLIVGIPVFLIIFLPNIASLFAPLFALVWSLWSLWSSVENFFQVDSVSYWRKYISLPLMFFSVFFSSMAQTILLGFILVQSVLIWADVIGLTWAILLTLFGLAPIIVITSPLVVWYTSDFSSFLFLVFLYFMCLSWSVVLILDSLDHRPPIPDEFFEHPTDQVIYYSPQIFLFGALSLQVIALPFYYFDLINVGDNISYMLGGVLLLASLVSVVKVRSLRKKISMECLENSYKPSIWIYVLGIVFTQVIYVGFLNFGAAIDVVAWICVFFTIALISRFLMFVLSKLKNIGGIER